MTFKDASNLHNGDEVIDRKTGESIKVLDINLITNRPRPIVLIEGVGTKQRYRQEGWINTEVR